MDDINRIIPKTEIKPKFVPVKCVVCNGHGTVTYQRIKCHGCQGKGYILVEGTEVQNG